MTELAAPQISSLMEALPGIAQVLRSPVASAMASLVRAAAGLEEFRTTEAGELLNFGVRRNLLTQEEVDGLLAEVGAGEKRGVKAPTKSAPVAKVAVPKEARPAKAPPTPQVASPDAKAKAAKIPPKAAKATKATKAGKVAKATKRAAKVVRPTAKKAAKRAAKVVQPTAKKAAKSSAKPKAAKPAARPAPKKGGKRR